jgi:MYXO-CTERM domain-containing protein
LVGALAHAKELPGYDVRAGAAKQGPALSPALSRELARAGGVAASIDARRGVPTFVWAARGQQAPGIAATPEGAARQHLARFARAYGLSPAALGTAEVAGIHDLGQGAVIVTFRQRVGGVELFRADAKVMMRQDLSLVAISGNLRPDAAPGDKALGAFRAQAGEAVAGALKDLYGLSIAPAALTRASKVQAGYSLFDLAPTPEVQAAKLRFVEPARVKQVLFPMPDRLVPAYFVEILAGRSDDVGSDAYAFVLAADDGRLLYREDLTQHDAFNYRVWAETTGVSRPLDGPHTDFTPHPTGTPDESSPQFIAPELISMEGFNTNPSSAADPWLPASAVQTFGNNVDAYADINAPDGYSNGDLRATTTSSKTFDRVYDVTIGPVSSAEQTMAATTQLFYVTNWLHDWYYDSGFDEAAANAQLNNFGRGGVAGDPLHAEAQDGANSGNRNNANMSTPADGISPRMQMYLWSGQDVHREINVGPTVPLPDTGVAGFGPPDFDIAGDLVVADDAAGASPTDGCEAPFAHDVTGKIVLIDRGNCTFKLKAVNAEAGGAIGVIIANNTPGARAPTLGNGDPPVPVTIPTLSVSFEEGGALKAALQTGPLTAGMHRIAGIERDGDIDNTIIAHEWGHYLHHRLSACGTHTCGALSEGWADFNAAHMVIREGDDLDGVFALAIYSTDAQGDSGYYGIRRYPYSVDMTKNPLTFRHISTGELLPDGVPHAFKSPDNAEVHNAGEIWAQMLFDAYVALLKESQGASPPYTFEQARRLMSDYVVAGLKMAPVDATYTETRDAILAAALARSEDDMMVLADAFAQRGAGSCAESPDRYSEDLVGVVESFELHPKIEVLGARIDDAVVTCDGDGLLDAQETGRVTVEVRNGGVMPLANTTATVTSATPGVVFPGGATVSFGNIPAFGTATATVEIGLDESITDMENLDLDVIVTDPDACTPTVEHLSAPLINLDDTPASSTIDTVESAIEAWTKTGDHADAIWERVDTATVNHIWHGFDYADSSDSQLESPDLLVSPTDPFVITFDHAFQFEASGSPITYWDGAVIEVSRDGGVTWEDIGAYGDPGYNGVIFSSGGNALNSRSGFVDTNATWPASEPVTIDLGTSLAGETVRIRFRIGTDSGSGAYGWSLDNLSFAGITNTPFASVGVDQALCQAAPIADAGEDQTVRSGDGVTLDASGSSDPNGDDLTFAWTQTAGPQVMLGSAMSAAATFTAPAVQEETTLTFQVTVSDGQASAGDLVDVVVAPSSDGTTSSSGTGGTPQPPPPGDDDGCGCSVVGDAGGGAAGAPLLGLGLLLLARRRRRS